MLPPMTVEQIHFQREKVWRDSWDARPGISTERVLWEICLQLAIAKKESDSFREFLKDCMKKVEGKSLEEISVIKFNYPEAHYGNRPAQTYG